MADEILIYTGSFDETMPIPFFEEGVRAGFPSPALDYMRQSLDFNRDMIQHPDATFYARVVGDSMKDAGIDQGDIVVIDRSLEASHDDIVIAYVNGEFTLKYIDLSHKNEGYIELVPANDHYPRIRVDEQDQFTIWGVVLWTIKSPRRR